MSACLQKVGLGATVRPNGSEAQAFEPGISAKNRPPTGNDSVDSVGESQGSGHFGFASSMRPGMKTIR
ncbi:MAG: hypothetical protein ACREEK_21150, partial [Bradyrhizobium sp.]